MRVSPSMLETFVLCPLKYRFRYIDHRPERKPWPFRVLGRAIHDAIADFERLAGDEKHTLRVLEDLFRYHWQMEDRTGFKSKEDEAQWGRKGLNMLRHYFESVVGSTERPWLCEARISARFPNFRLVGRVDQIYRMSDGRMKLVELKSGDYVVDQEEVDDDLQLTMYALAITHQFGIAPEDLEIELWHLAARQKFATSRSREQLEVATLKINELVEAIQRETAFKPIANRFCRWCDYANICPTY